jgi:hypothetical protein
MIRTNRPCCGLYNHLKCPYQSIIGTDKCLLHKDNTDFNKIYKKDTVWVSWIEKSKKRSSKCCLCSNTLFIIPKTFKTCNEKHSYCENCISLCDDECPLCLSMKVSDMEVID